MLAVGCLLVGFCVAAFGGLLAALSRNDMQVPQLNNLFVLLGGMIGGALVPLSIMPSFVQMLAPFTPQYWAMELFKGATSRGASSGALMWKAVVLFAFAADLFAISLIKMRWDRFRHA
jgi:ABC-2 type transport system permease protein